MNIEKINKLYENMITLQELFNEEPDAVPCIMGLRMASSEFRSAFFKVRETLLECKVGNLDNRKPTAEKKEEKSEGITEYHKDGTIVDIPVEKKEKPSEAPKAPKVEKKSESITEKKEEIPETKTEKKESSAISKFEARNNTYLEKTKVALENFILENYEFSKDAKKIPIKDLIKEWMRIKRCHMHPRFEQPLINHIKSVFNVESDMIGLTSRKIEKTESTKKEDKLNDDYIIKSIIGSEIKYYRHPKYNTVIVSEKGKIYEFDKNGKLIECKISDNPTGPKVKISFFSYTISPRKLCFEAYTGMEIKGRNCYVYCRNGNKNDFSIENLYCPKMSGEKREAKYYSDDIIAVCEYIVAHNKDIHNIEKDTNWKYGYGFAKSILDKKVHTKISDKYF